jgi:hypothetical protein
MKETKQLDTCLLGDELNQKVKIYITQHREKYKSIRKFAQKAVQELLQRENAQNFAEEPLMH